jgi:hypothetical protein
MANHIVRKGSIYRIGVVIETETNLYFYRIRSEISYFQNYNAIPNIYIYINTHTDG